MKHICIFILSIVGFNSFSFSQQYELGIFSGISQYYGDLSHQWMHKETIHPAIGLSVEYRINNNIAILANGRITQLSGKDALSEKPELLVRNLSFRTDIYELGGKIKWFPFGNTSQRKFVLPYFTTGVNLFYFNPQANYLGEWVDLQPLGTEGQGTSAFPGRKPYNRLQLGLPVGGGIKIALGSVLTVGLESTLQFTVTDYIDDVSLSYVDPAILITENGALAFALSNRTGEYLHSEPVNLGNGSKRGNTSISDYYGYFGVTIGMIIPKNLIQLNDSKKHHLECSF